MTDSKQAQTVLLTSADGVATMTLNRPEVLNALDKNTLDVLARRFAQVHDDPDVRAVVVTGRGRAFCAGGDLQSLSSGAGWADDPPARVGDGFRYGAGIFHQVVLAMRSLPKPVIAAIHGPAAGGGMSLALACDLRVMSSETFMQPGYLGRGFSPDGGMTHTLPLLVGPALALELALADRRISAEECLARGLVGEVAPPEQVVARAAELGRGFARGPSLAIAQTKALICGSMGRSAAAQMELERVAIAECAESAEGREGVRAFFEKREPDFTRTSS